MPAVSLRIRGRNGAREFRAVEAPGGRTTDLGATGRTVRPRNRHSTIGVTNDTITDVGKGIEELLVEMRGNPEGIRFADACRVATHHFGPPRTRGSSHHAWKMPWPGDPRVNLQRGDGGKAKAYQVRQLLQAIARRQQEETP
jgi:hypothetical protein